eukprot:g53438.t1
MLGADGPSKGPVKVLYYGDRLLTVGWAARAPVAPGPASPTSSELSQPGSIDADDFPELAMEDIEQRRAKMNAMKRLAPREEWLFLEKDDPQNFLSTTSEDTSSDQGTTGTPSFSEDSDSGLIPPICLVHQREAALRKVLNQSLTIVTRTMKMKTARAVEAEDVEGIDATTRDLQALRRSEKVKASQARRAGKMDTRPRLKISAPEQKRSPIQPLRLKGKGSAAATTTATQSTALPTALTATPMGRVKIVSIGLRKCPVLIQQTAGRTAVWASGHGGEALGLVLSDHAQLSCRTHQPWKARPSRGDRPRAKIGASLEGSLGVASSTAAAPKKADASAGFNRSQLQVPLPSWPRGNHVLSLENQGAGKSSCSGSIMTAIMPCGNFCSGKSIVLRSLINPLVGGKTRVLDALPKFIFVFGAGRRLLAEDLAAFHAVRDAFDIKPESIVLIFNKPTRRAKATYEADMLARVRTAAGLGRDQKVGASHLRDTVENMAVIASITICALVKTKQILFTQFVPTILAMHMLDPRNELQIRLAQRACVLLMDNRLPPARHFRKRPIGLPDRYVKAELDLRIGSASLMPKEIGLLQAWWKLDLSIKPLASPSTELGLLQALQMLDVSMSQLARLSL